MLGNLLRRNSPSTGNPSRSLHNLSQTHDEYDITPMTSNTTIKMNNSSHTSLGTEHSGSVPCSCVDSLCSTLPMLDHVSDELKYKLFASKNMNFRQPSPATACSPYAYRVLIMEELGHMTNRGNYTVVLDYPTINGSRKYDQIRPNELKEYIFGSPVRSNESLQESKFRTIPNSELVMVTRIFHSPVTNNRLAVSICVPIDLLQVIAEAWLQVSLWLDECQDIVLGILKMRSRYKNWGLPDDIQSSFPKECSNVISLLQRKLIPCLKSMSQIPRLFLYPDTFQNFIGTWFKDIFNWIGIKDGPRLNFLPALLAKIICDFQNPTKAPYTTRIVIMSGNMVVANKLIFILSGLLKPRYRACIEIEPHKECSHHSDGRLGECHQTSSKRDTGRKLSTSFERSMADLSKYLPTRKPWEIPYNNSSNSIVSVSSDESLAHVIQPSSLKSTSNSLQYLSSSLSSQQGSSYGSWFNKRPSVSQLIHGSPSAKINDQWEKPTTGSMRKTSSNTSLHQMFTRNTGTVTPQQSPSISEYEEYPWFGTPTTGSSRAEQAPNHTRVPPNGAVFCEIDIKRDCQRLNQSELLENAFNEICRPARDFELEDIQYEIIPGDSRHAPYMQIDVDYETVNQIIPAELLPRYTTYLSNFNRWFNLQAFPVSSESESRVISNMKRDLQTSSLHPDVNANSKTLLVSLRSREIKEITIMRNDSKSATASTHGIVQKTKKIFNNGKCGNVSSRLTNCISFVNASIKKAMDLNDDPDVVQDEKDQEISKIFLSLLYYTSLS